MRLTTRAKSQFGHVPTVVTALPLSDESLMIVTEVLVARFATEGVLAVRARRGSRAF